MPYALGAINVQAGQSYTVPVGSAGTVGAVVCANESPYAVNASISPTGAPGQWIVAQTADLIACDVSGFNGTLTFTTDNYLSNAASAPSFLLYLTAYAPGEAIRGTYPAPLVRLANGSIGVATQLVNDGNTVGTNIIESTPAGAVSSYVLVRNDGTFDLQAISNNVLTDIFHLTPGDATHAAKLVATLMQTTGSLLVDGGTIKTDGNGTLQIGVQHGVGTGKLMAETIYIATVPTLGAPPNVTITVPGYTLIANAGTPAPGNAGTSFQTIWNGATVNTFGVGDNPLNELAYIDHLGVLHATAPVTLAAGNQETGFAGLEGTANAGNNVSLGVNFKTVMTNTPSSLTLTTSFSGNTTTQTATGITKYGFWLSVKATANGDTYWAGTYTTVGNCLLAVDTAAQTFDQHCDACGAVHRAQPFTAALVEHTPLLALSYVCPACGARDCFNTALTAADEADTTPQGSGEFATTRGAQATLIRSLLTALGLEVAA